MSVSGWLWDHRSDSRASDRPQTIPINQWTQIGPYCNWHKRVQNRKIINILLINNDWESRGFNRKSNVNTRRVNHCFAIGASSLFDSNESAYSGCIFQSPGIGFTNDQFDAWFAPFDLWNTDVLKVCILLRIWIIHLEEQDWVLRSVINWITENNNTWFKNSRRLRNK